MEPHNRIVKTVFFDVDTQLDFLYPAGALYVPGAEKLIDSLAALTRYASGNDIQIISTADAHTEDDPEFATWKPHCVAGTFGQQKAGVTLLNQAKVLSTQADALNQLHPALNVARQIIVEKQKLDAFTNPHLGPLLDVLKADRFVLYGVVTELCVRSAAFGLLDRGARVELVVDATQGLHAPKERDFLDEFELRSGTLTTVGEVTA